MSKLSNEEINNIILANGCKPRDISTYTNLDSKIIVEYKGGLFATTVHDLRKEAMRETIQTIDRRGFKPIEIIGYTSKSSNISVCCPEGHKVVTTLKELDKDNFKCPTCMNKGLSTYVQSGIVPPKNGYRIIAFDQSSNNIGVSIYDNGKLVYYDWYQIQGELNDRIMKMYKFMDEKVIPEWKPDYLYFEDIQYQQGAGVTTYKVLAMILGVCIAAATKNNIPHTEILNKVWQQEFNILGSNRVQQKSNVIEKVRQYFNLNVTDDVADAILIGKYAAIHLYDKWTEDDF